jgi:hypothetical protein
MCGVNIMDRVRNEEVHKRSGSEVVSTVERMDRNVLKWYSHMQIIEEETVVKNI